MSDVIDTVIEVAEAYADVKDDTFEGLVDHYNDICEDHYEAVDQAFDNNWPDT